MEHLKQETTSGAQLNMDALYQICPQCFTESKDPKTGEVKHTVDFDKLRLLLGDNVAEGDECYDFTWVGKRAALQEAAKPIRKTLRPCPEESVDWENTKNLYIEGDNLEVLKLLQNSYMGKVKMIYIDPPYNTGNDFVYQDDFHQTKQEYDLFSGDVNEEGERLVRNTESNGRFHSDWCSMIYSRLMVARSLLSNDGLIFISISDVEISNIKKICEEIFGASNFVADLIWANKEGGGSSDSKLFRIKHEHILCFSKEIDNIAIKGVQISNAERYKGKDEYLSVRGPYYLQKLGMGSIQYSQSLDYPIEAPDGSSIYPADNNKGKRACWRWSKEKYEKNKKMGFVEIKKDSSDIWTVYTKQYMNCDNDGNLIERSQRPMGIIEEYSSTQASKMLQSLDIPFDYSKPYELIQYIVSRIYDDDCIVLDFFSGSATTAHAVMHLNYEKGGYRKYILIQWPEDTPKDSVACKAGYKNICEIGKERIRRAGKIIMDAQKSKQSDLFAGEQKKLDVGFRVFKCADSNMKDVYYAPADYSQQMLFDLEDNIKEDRNDLDLLFGCMLDWGVTLDLPLRTEKVDGVNIHVVNEGDLVACFEKHIPESVIDHIASLLPM